MKKTIKFLGIALITSSMFASCSIEKRHYMSGYHIEWKQKQSTNFEKQTEQTAEDYIPTIDLTEEELDASASPEVSFFE